MKEKKVAKLKVAPHENMTMRNFKSVVHGSDLADAILMGYDKDGDLVIYSTKMSRSSALWLVKQTELHVLDI